MTNDDYDPTDDDPTDEELDDALASALADDEAEPEVDVAAWAAANYRQSIGRILHGGRDLVWHLAAALQVAPNQEIRWHIENLLSAQTVQLVTTLSAADSRLAEFVVLTINQSADPDTEACRWREWFDHLDKAITPIAETWATIAPTAELVAAAYKSGGIAEAERHANGDRENR